MSTSAHAEQQEPNAHNHLHHRTYVELYHHGLYHIKSSALLCAVGLGIPGAIHRRGGAATISDLVANTGVHPAKRSHLRRLMRMLTSFGIFGAGEQRAAAAAADDGESETVYTLTPVSSVLVADDKEASGASSLDMSALLRLLARPSTSVSTFFGLEEWFRDGGTTTLFEMALGVPPWSLTKNDAAYNRAMNEACVVDTSMAMDIMLNDTCRGGGASSIFSGLSSLVDVGGGHGAAAMAITTAFPHMNCSVLDLEQVIIKVPRAGTDHVHSTVQFIAGDMFESIPPTDAVFLKHVLDCWDDDHCVKILQQCKRAIPARDAGGKVIIMNVVVGYGSLDKVVKETQVLFDMYMMRYGGSERDEHEWRKIFSKAGFSDYKITPILGFHSIIEVFP
ncbi:acetylserotonin O-methyltransferase 2-like [Miscanthus floridulus]|uniref:acetylserotonin O-methyltransferase 2-like n=1 Tax=Miscanthus floridulus TaxID=154761 RepID=UPI0034595BDE